MRKRSRLGARFVTLIVAILSVTLGASAYRLLEREQAQMQEQLVERGRLLGHFVSRISTEAILAYDFVSLDSYVQDLSRRPDIVFGVIFDTRGRPLTHYFDADNPQVKTLARGQAFPSVQALVEAAERSPAVLVERFPIVERDHPLGEVVVGISRARLERELAANLRVLLFAYALSIAVLGLAIYLVFRRSVLFPVRALIAGSRRVAAGRFDDPVPVYAQDELGQLTEAFNVMMCDLSQDREKLNFQANYDALTGLPNRVLALDRLNGAISRAQRTGHAFAVIFIDLDNFKIINDTMGHQTGDSVLVALGKRFESVLRASDSIARLGGDEFLVMLPAADEASKAREVAVRLNSTLIEPLRLGEREVFLRCSMGIAIYPDDGANAEELMANADNAMYQAKFSPSEWVRFFAPEMNTKIRERLSLEHDLHLALERSQFRLYFQPIVDIRAERGIGAEVLLRWAHPEKGVIGPATFIPLAESTRHIIAIGEWVLREATRACRQLLDAGIPLEFITVNVSRLQLTEGFEAIVEGALADAGLPPRHLHLEVTESALMEHAGALPEMLRRLDGQGVKLVLDDFGTGFSSLNYLKHFPFHTLKIDKSFVDEVPGGRGDNALVRGIVAMGRSLGLEIVAEGVERDEQLGFLAESRVDWIQGYLFGRPMPLDEFRVYMRKRSPVADHADKIRPWCGAGPEPGGQPRAMNAGADREEAREA